jgi:CPA2 family monovalent cation:H+ antiporter-2
VRLAVHSDGLGVELLTLGVLFVLAYGLGRLGKRIGLPAIPIYMIVGLVASPNFEWIPFLNFESADVELIAVFGLILLLFSLGLEFDTEEFFGNARKLLLSGGTRIAINMTSGFVFGLFVGWGTREALIIAGMTAMSSSAIITKLLIELQRLANKETPTILGIAVVEDVFIAVYLAIVSVVLSGETEIWPIVVQLATAFAFLIAMFVIARYGARFVARLVGTRDDELFTIAFFGLALGFGGLGELLGVSDAIGAFLIGLVLGATRFRARIEQLALPLRDVFAAFFFLNFGLALDPSTFGEVVAPVAVAVVMTLVVNTAGGQLIARLNGLTPAQGLNVSTMLHNRGEFTLILATLAAAAGLDERLTPFAGLYVLSMAVIGPVLAVNSERISGFGGAARRTRRVDAQRDRDFALAERAMSGGADGDEIAFDIAAEVAPPSSPSTSDPVTPEAPQRERDPEY